MKEKTETPGEAPEGRLRKNVLARELGISRVTLDRFLYMDGAPPCDRQATYEVEAVAQFIAQQKVEEGKIRGKSYWESEKARLHCERIAHELAVQRGEYISRSDAGKTIVPLMAELGQILKQEFEMVNPSKYLGKDRVECTQINAASIDKIIRRFRSGIGPLTA